MPLKIKFTLIGIFFWWSQAMVLAQLGDAEVIALPVKTPRNLIGNYVYFYEDKTNQLTINDIIERDFGTNFKRHYKDVLNFSYSKSTFWVKFHVQKTKNAEISEDLDEWLAVIDYPILDHITFYYQDKEKRWQSLQIGDMVAFKTRPIKHRFFVFPLYNLDNEPISYYFKIDTESTVNIPLSVQKANDFYQNIIPTEIYYGIFVGIFLLVILNNLFLYFYLREASYIWYVLFILSNLIMNLCLSGHIFQYFFTDFAGWQNKGMLAAFALTNFLSPVYAIYFLDVKRYNVWFLYILTGLVIIGIVVFMGVFFLPYRVITGLAQLNSLIILITVLSIGGIIWNRGVKSARFYVIGYCLYFICVLPAILKNFVTIPTGFYLFIEHGTELGVLCEAVLLSIGLADKTRLERRKAQREKEEAQKETIRVQQEANEMLERKVDERTKQLQEVNEELRASEEEIRQQAEELRTINESLHLAQNELQTAFNEIEQKNKDITASINYASRIQSAMLVLDDEIKNVFPQNFIFFKPRDIVSGDFYWFYKQESKSIVIAIDCTGHGVPGAFMSMIADSLLNQIIIEKEILQADLILNEMQKSIQKSLKQDITENRDGMDLALCIVDYETQTLEYAGAHNPLIIIQNNEIREIKGDPFGIGGYQGKENKNFTRHIIDINPRNVGETMFYLYSDGFQDQFGGPNNKKFLPRRFRELLLEISQQPLKTQKELLEKTFKAWVEPDNRQIDDVLVIGVKLS